MRKFLLLSAGLIASALALLRLLPLESRHRTTGLEVKIAQAVPCSADSIRGEMVRVSKSGLMLADSRLMAPQELDRLLEETFRTRVQRVVYVAAERGVSFEDVIAGIDIAAKRADHVSLVTPAVEREVQSHPAYCLNPNIKFSGVLL